MPLFSRFYPYPVCPPGIKWDGNEILCSLYAENAHRVEYFFYEDPYELGMEDTRKILARVTLTGKHFCFGNYWNWKAEVSDHFKKDTLGVLIKVEKPGAVKGTLEYRWVIEPYTKESAGAENWGEPCTYEVSTQTYAITKIPRPTNNKMTHRQVRRLPVIRRYNPLAKRPPRPQIKPEHTVVYEGHVRGLTKLMGDRLSNPDYAGTYRGLVELIPHFKKLGITAVELLPIFDFDENEWPRISPVTNQMLYNYWGYSTLLFLAPKQNFAYDTKNPVKEIKEMVDAFHEAGLEVFLDVVYNHTAEGGRGGPVDHFKWLGQEAYYMHDHHDELANYSGCGNTVNCSHPVAKRLIIHSLTYWANEIGVDGFRFDLASILTRSPQGSFHMFPHLLWEIRNEPALVGIKVIAEPWDAGGGYHLGHLAYHADWAEWNDRFRDTIRKAVRGDEGMIKALKDSIEGSPDVYQRRGTDVSVNFITAHDGFTLYDLVSYDHKHNEANGENNRDGSDHDYSFNCGHEGPTEDAGINALRMKKMRLFHGLLHLSCGIPMMLGGDEFARTQQGNNNPYCQDSPINWVDWSLAEKNADLVDFVSQLIAFRKKNSELLYGRDSEYRWFNNNANELDTGWFIRTMCWQVKHPDHPRKQICFFLNTFSEPLEFMFPEPGKWQLVINTSNDSHEPQIINNRINVDGFCLQVYELRKGFQPKSRLRGK